MKGLFELIFSYNFCISIRSEVRALSYSGDGKYLAAISEEGVLAIVRTTHYLLNLDIPSEAYEFHAFYLCIAPVRRRQWRVS